MQKGLGVQGQNKTNVSEDTQKMRIADIVYL